MYMITAIKAAQAINISDEDVFLAVGASCFIRDSYAGYCRRHPGVFTVTEVSPVGVNAAGQLVDPTGTAINFEKSISLFGVDLFVAGALVSNSFSNTTGTCDIATQAIPGATSTTALGTQLAWGAAGTGTIGGIAGVLFNDAAASAFLTTDPTGIYIPAGVTRASFTCSVQFPNNAIGTRVIRLIVNNLTHVGNTSAAANADATANTWSQVLVYNSGYINVVAGEKYSLHVLQNSGATLTITPGNISNKGASTFLRASFK